MLRQNPGGAFDPRSGRPTPFGDLARYRFSVSQLAARLTHVHEVLDVGSGFGLAATLFVQSGVTDHVTGVEIDAEALAYADRKRAELGLENVTFVLGTFRELPASYRADAGIALEVLEHVPDPLGLLQEVHRVLNPGGLLLLSTPNAVHQHRPSPFHLQEFPASAVDQLLRQAGFQPDTLFAEHDDNSYPNYVRQSVVPKRIRAVTPGFVKDAWMKLRKRGEYATADSVRFVRSGLEMSPEAPGQFWVASKGNPAP